MALANIITAFGLSGAAGLNAYIPLLIAALLGRAGLLQLSEPFDVLTSDLVIAALVVLGLIEFFADKIPGVDSVNDAVQTFIRPAAGAILFAANTGVVAELSPAIALVLGLLTASGVHVTKAAARPAINMATMGIGAPFVSVAEDILSAVSSLLAILAPVLFVIFAVLTGYFVWRLLLRVRRARSKPTTLPAR